MTCLDICLENVDENINKAIDYRLQREGKENFNLSKTTDCEIVDEISLHVHKYMAKLKETDSVL